MSEIQDLIARGDLQMALAQLKEINPSYSSEIILQQSRLSRLDESKRLGIISSSEMNVSINQITTSVIAIAKKIIPDYSPSSPNITPKENPMKTKKNKLESIVKKIRFDKSMADVKEAAKKIISSIKEYEKGKIEDEYFDVGLEAKRKIESSIDSFVKTYGDRIQTRDKKKIMEIKKAAAAMEDDFSKESLSKLAGLMTAYDAKFAKYQPLINSAQEYQLEGLAQQVADDADLL
ncbi:MAG: hypothetical protein AAF927_01765 [Bacteroidota bacterium]